MDLKSLSVKELEALLTKKNAEVDALRLEVKAISSEIKGRAAADKVAQIMAGMSPEEQKRLITKLAPTAIKSDEKFGKLGG